jgi:hypothetical protein
VVELGEQGLYMISKDLMPPESSNSGKTDAGGTEVGHTGVVKDVVELACPEGVLDQFFTPSIEVE